MSLVTWPCRNVFASGAGQGQLPALGSIDDERSLTKR